MSGISRRAALLAAAVPVASASFAWSSLRLNYFMGDDFFHLYDLVTRSPGSLLTEFWGGHFLFLYNLVFLAAFRLFGPEPAGFFWSMLVTHVVNTALLYGVIRRSTGDVAIACFGATIWGTSPILSGALGWYSVYGQVLLTTITLAALASLQGATAAPAASLSPARAACWVVLLALGSTAFGMGLGIAVAFPLAAALVVPHIRASRGGLLVLLAGALATLTGYELAMALWYVPPSQLGDPSPVGMLRDAPAAFALLAHLVGFGAAALLFDVVGRSEQWPDWSAAAGGGVLCLLMLAGWLGGAPRIRRCLVASTLLTVAVYGAVAAGRAHVYDVFFRMSAAAAAKSARYHYLPAALLAVVVTTAMAGIGSRSRGMRRAIAGAASVAVVLRLALLAAFPFSIDHWDAERAEAAAMPDTIRREVAAAPPGAVVTIENRPFGPTRFFPDLMPGWAGMFVVFFPDDVVDGRHARFAVSEADWRRAQERGGRIAEIVVPR